MTVILSYDCHPELDSGSHKNILKPYFLCNKQILLRNKFAGLFFYTGNFLLGSTSLTNQKPGFPRFRCLPQLHCYATALQPFQSLLLTTRKVFLQKKKDF
jgi:hypothetical protein